MSEGCIFCQMIQNKIPCHVIDSNDDYMAFLTIFPNTLGATVVIPKKHYPSYAFDMPPQALADLMMATQKVAKKLDKAFPDVSRTGMFFEGFGVDHVHSKLSPMHGTGDLTHWKPIESRQTKFFEQYEGYLSSHDHERADDAKLAALAARIREA